MWPRARAPRSYALPVGAPLKTTAAAAATVLTVLLALLALADGLRTIAPPRTALLARERDAVVLETPPGDLFARAGIRAGDAIVGLDGHALTRRAQLNESLRRTRPGQQIVFQVRRGADTLDLPVVAERNLTPWGALRFAAPILAALVLGAGIYFRRRDLRGAGLILLGGLSPAIFTAQLATGPVVDGASGLVLLFDLAFGLFNGALMLHFFLTFPERGRLQRALLPFAWLAYAVGAALGWRFLLPLFVPAVEPLMPGAAGTAALFRAYDVVESLCLLLSAVSAAGAARSARTLRARRQGVVLCGGALLAFAAYTGLWVVPRHAGRAPLIDAVSLTTLMMVMPAAIAIAIVFHRMFDINVLRRERLVYGVASGAIAVLFVAAAAGVGALAAPFAGDAPLAALAAGAAVIAIGVHPLRSVGRRLVDRVLYRKRYDFRPALTEISMRLAGMLDLHEAIPYLHLRIDALLGPEWIAVVLRRGEALEAYGPHGDPAEYAGGPAARDVVARLEGGRDTVFEPEPGTWPVAPAPALVAAMSSGGAVIGAIVLGPRRVDVPYRTLDHDLLGTLAAMAGAVLERGRLAQERSQRERLALVGTATAAVVHELKNPLAAIKSTTAVLGRRLSGDPRSGELAGIVEREIDRLQDTILNVLSYVRPVESVPQPFLLADTLPPLVGVVDADFRAAGVEVAIRGADPRVPVLGDPARVRQMVLNLLLNAREAMPRGGHVDVSIEPWLDDAGRTRGLDVVVRDEGPGFSAEGLARAFEPFYTTKRLGTGLGLANVRRLAEEHGGAVRLANRPQGGAEVHLCLRSAAATGPGGEEHR